MKTCRLCAETKPADQFYASLQLAGGLRNECKSCCKKQATESRKKAMETDIDAFREKRREYGKKWVAEAQLHYVRFLIRKKTPISAKELNNKKLRGFVSTYGNNLILKREMWR